jgi:hypothetical protein
MPKFIKASASVFIILIIYLLFKIYVLYTPTPSDDEVPDQLLKRIIVANYVEDNAQSP